MGVRRGISALAATHLMGNTWTRIPGRSETGKRRAKAVASTPPSSLSKLELFHLQHPSQQTQPGQNKRVKDEIIATKSVIRGILFGHEQNPW